MYTQVRLPFGLALDEKQRRIFWGARKANGGLFVTGMDGSTATKLYGPSYVYNIDLDAAQE